MRSIRSMRVRDRLEPPIFSEQLHVRCKKKLVRHAGTSHVFRRVAVAAITCDATRMFKNFALLTFSQRSVRFIACLKSNLFCESCVGKAKSSSSQTVMRAIDNLLARYGKRRLAPQRRVNSFSRDRIHGRPRYGWARQRRAKRYAIRRSQPGPGAFLGFCPVFHHHQRKLGPKPPFFAHTK